MRRALVVDDALSNRQLFGMQVRKLGFQVVEAQDGLEAVADKLGIDPKTKEIANPPEFNFSVIFMDSVMPRMSGLEATALIRAAGVRVPVVGVTGNALEEDILAFRQAGANAVLTKPVSRAMLKAKLVDLGFTFENNNNL